jgi:hypothetical protein
MVCVECKIDSSYCSVSTTLTDNHNSRSLQPMSNKTTMLRVMVMHLRHNDSLLLCCCAQFIVEDDGSARLNPNDESGHLNGKMSPRAESSHIRLGNISKCDEICRDYTRC